MHVSFGVLDLSIFYQHIPWIMWLLTCVLMQLFLLQSTSGTFSCSKQSSPWIITNDPDNTLQFDGKAQCVLDCEYNESCSAVYYGTSSKQCLQFSNMMITLIYKQEGSNDEFIVFVRNMQYLYVNRPGEFYHTDAIQACNDLGARLMTELELQTLYDAGGERCGCSWLQEGTKKYIMQESVNGCGNAPGIHDCADLTTTGAAWCIIDP